jgi:hypothetical protein
VDLLLRTGQVEDVDEDLTAAATEIAELCGFLPLYLSICGGIIVGYEGNTAWKAELVQMLLVDRVGVIDDGSGEDTVQRLVDSSLNMVSDEVSLTFMALGVCPEDVLVALPVVQLICAADPQLVATGLKVNAVTMRRTLKSLLSAHLLQGSIENGVQMHDIVRDLVRSRLGGDDGIREKQRAVVGALIAACPENGGWPDGDVVGQFAALALEFHVSEALLPNPLVDTEAHEWLLHADALVVAHVATAIGSTSLEALAAAKEAAGELVGAARVAWASRLVQNTPARLISDLMLRAADLMELADDPSCADFERKVLQQACTIGMGTDRSAKVNRRAVALSGEATYQSKAAQSHADFTTGLISWGLFAPDAWPLSEAAGREATRLMRQSILTHLVDAGKLTDNRSLQLAVVVRYHAHLGDCFCCCHMADVWDPNLLGGESALAEAMEFYTFEGMGAEQKAGVLSVDQYRNGNICASVLLWFGNLHLLDKWVVDVTAGYKQLDFPSSRNFTNEQFEVFFGIQNCVLLIKAGRPMQAQSVLAAMGFDWSDEGLALLGVYTEAILASLPGNKEAQSAFGKLVIYLAAPLTAALDASVSAWIPAPVVLAQYERASGTIMVFFVHGILSLAARVFLKLGRDDDAEETARIAVSVEHHTLRKYDLVECHTVLGQVAAKRGDVEAARGHFARGLEEARASRLPMLELLLARDWQRAVGEYEEADAVIDAACAQMGKTRAQMASVL